MIVRPGVRLDVGQMDAGRRAGQFAEGASGLATGTGDGGECVELDQRESVIGSGRSHERLGLGSPSISAGATWINSAS